MAWMDTTWDGSPVARERPFAVAIVVWRRGQSGTGFLLFTDSRRVDPALDGLLRATDAVLSREASA